jgi:hypothetical protein
MNNELIRNHYDAFLRIEAFHIKYGANFSAAGKASGLFAELAALIPELERRGVGQLEGSTHYHSGTSAKQAAAEQLRTHLRKLRDTARAIAVADKNPAFAEPFVLPRSQAFAPLVTQAKLSLAAARPLTARFVEFELPASFLDALEAEIDRFESASDDQDAGLSTQVGGTAGMVTAVDRGVELRSQLVPLVRNKFEHDPSILAEWETASRIVRVKRSREAEPVAEPEPSSGR